VPGNEWGNLKLLVNEYCLSGINRQPLNANSGYV
jgi:hypothetical protein